MFKPSAHNPLSLLLESVLLSRANGSLDVPLYESEKVPLFGAFCQRVEPLWEGEKVLSEQTQPFVHMTCKPLLDLRAKHL